MRLQIVQFFILLISAGHLAAQANGVVVGGKWADQIAISDVNGRPFENRYADVNGSPYFDVEYKFSKIILNNGPKFVNIKTKINLVTQQTVFITANEMEAYLEAGRVKEITYADTSTTGITLYKFQTGFPPAGKQTVNNFYQVIAEGRCSFLKSVTKNISERKSELSGEISKDFETTENYYLFVKGEMKSLKKDKTFILLQLADKQDQINQFIQPNKINYKNAVDLAKLFTFYNTL